jgi:hypothetical protein
MGAEGRGRLRWRGSVGRGSVLSRSKPRTARVRSDLGESEFCWGMSRNQVARRQKGGVDGLFDVF